MAHLQTAASAPLFSPPASPALAHTLACSLPLFPPHSPCKTATLTLETAAAVYLQASGKGAAQLAACQVSSRRQCRRSGWRLARGEGGAAMKALCVGTVGRSGGRLHRRKKNGATYNSLAVLVAGRCMGRGLDHVNYGMHLSRGQGAATEWARTDPTNRPDHIRFQIRSGCRPDVVPDQIRSLNRACECIQAMSEGREAGRGGPGAIVAAGPSQARKKRDFRALVKRV